MLGAMLAMGSGVAGAQTILVSGGTLVDPTQEQPTRVADVLVRDGVVVDIGAAIPRPEGAALVDARGHFLLAGLWDMHAHLAAVGEIGRAPEQYVGHGVLHVRDMGGRLDDLLALRDAVRTHARVGPTVVMAGPTLNGEASASFHRQVRGADEARAAVRDLHARGVDFIKVHRAMGREAFDAIADETRRLGLPFAGHVPLVLDWVTAARAGMRTIEHIPTLFENLRARPGATDAIADIAAQLEGPTGDAIFAAMRVEGTYFDPTLIGYEVTIDRAAQELATRRRSAYALMRRIAARAVGAGVPIVTGTDVLERHGDLLLVELERLAAIGLAPREVLRAATVTSAAAARRPDLGRIAIGAPASFLVLARDPLEDVRHVRALAWVVHGRRLLDAAALAALRNPAP
jgi:imidazolonepropionase-like amidohydrolase